MNIEGITGGWTTADLFIELPMGRMYIIMQTNHRGGNISTHLPPNLIPVCVRPIVSEWQETLE